MNASIIRRGSTEGCLKRFEMCPICLGALYAMLRPVRPCVSVNTSRSMGRQAGPSLGMARMSDGYLRLASVIAATGLPRSSLYRLIGEGCSPKQVSLT
ncbi:MAG: AlpA family phage regulatory protein, partial [Lysobacteraceae bacterium]